MRNKYEKKSSTAKLTSAEIIDRESNTKRKPSSVTMEMNIIMELIKANYETEAQERILVDIEALGFNDRMPLHVACEKEKFDNVVTLLKHGANVNSQDHPYRNTPLFYALKASSNTSSIKIINLLREREANLTYRNLHGQIITHEACRVKNTKLIEYLLTIGVELESVDDLGNTPLHLSSNTIEHNEKVINCLIKNGANLAAFNSAGQLPLHLAYIKQNINIIVINHDPLLAAYLIHQDLMLVQWLIDRGIDIESKDRDGNSAWQIACQAGSINRARVLLENGADINSRDNRQQNVLRFKYKI